MKEKNMESITIKKSVEGKFGPQVQTVNGDYYSFSKFYTGDTDLAAGVYQADVYVTAKGNKYINSIEGVPGETYSEEHTEDGPRVATVKPLVKKASQKVKAEDVAETAPNWDEINRGKVRSLFVQAILSNPNLAQSLGDVDVDAISVVVEPLVGYVFGDK